MIASDLLVIIVINRKIKLSIIWILLAKCLKFLFFQHDGFRVLFKSFIVFYLQMI